MLTKLINPFPVKERKREAYRLSPLPVKERNRVAYHINPTLAKARSKSALMTMNVPESEEQDLYHDYTIHVLHAPRENEKASRLYQLLRINESPIDAHSKKLDLLCFPDYTRMAMVVSTGLEKYH